MAGDLSAYCRGRPPDVGRNLADGSIRSNSAGDEFAFAQVE
jgi:hypothetical protein